MAIKNGLKGNLNCNFNIYFNEKLFLDCQNRKMKTRNQSNKNDRPRISDEMRYKVVDLHQDQLGYKKIAKITGISISTIRWIIKKHARTGQVANLPKSGRPKKTSKRLDKLIVKQFEENPFSTAEDVNKYLKNNNLADISTQTVRNRINDADLGNYSARKKPLLSPINIQKRLFFAKKYLKKSENFWNKVIWSDESKFNLCQSDRSKRVYRKKNTSLDPKHLISTLKHGGGNIMVWGCMSSAGAGSLAFIHDKMNQQSYVDILNNNLEFSAHLLGLGNDFLFMQDNDPKHTSKYTSDWLEENGFKLLKTPPQSPDINPIEHLWYHLKRKLGDKRYRNKEQLKNAIMTEWNQIDPEYTRKLVESMPRRLEAIVKANGGHTKY